MDIRDFQGINKFKIIIPTIYIFSWISMLIGPVFFDPLYQRLCAFFICILVIKVSINFMAMLIITYKSHYIFKRITNPPPSLIQKGNAFRAQMQTNSTQINYGFIIPNYKEEIEVLEQTLNVLAAHTRAKQSYLIFLAMQAHEEGSQEKANILVDRFKDKFKLVQYTIHQVRQFQQKGKASNVSWCAEHLEPIFQKNMISQQSVFLTIIDADSWAPNIFYDLMEEHLVKNFQKRHKFIYQPPQIFTRNNLDVPVTTRVYDLMHSFAHCSNLYSFFDVTFPLSNYVLSYNLAKRMGFWDTCADAIGQDFHTTQKAFWKTAGDIITVPIYVPFNQMNIATGKGYKEDVLARFWQAQRHAQGVADVAWQFKMLFTKKFKPMNLVVFYQIIETFTLPALVPWIFISLGLQPLFLYRGVERPQHSVPPIVFSIFFNILTFGGIVGYLLLEVLKRRANKIVYNQKNESIFRIAEYLLLFSVNLFLISVPTFVIAAFNTVLGNTQYIVAQKKNKKKQQENI